MDHVRWQQRPRLRRPILLAAFEGWNDAGDAASTAARYLGRTWEAQQFADVDPEDFYDFTALRPEVRLVDGLTRSIQWPQNQFAAASTGGSHDVVFLHGIEPHLRWRTFCEQVIGVAQDLGVEMVLTLGALLTDRPHSRPVHVIGTATDADLIERLHLQRSRYEGPTGILGVMQSALSGAGIASASLWASVPHYLSQTPSPKAALALVRRASEIVGSPVRPVDLEIATAQYERQVDEILSENEEMAAYVRQLELAGGEEDDNEDTVAESNLPGGDELAAEVERFLRDQGPG